MNFRVLLFVGCCLLAGCSYNESIKPIANGTQAASGESVKAPVHPKVVAAADTAHKPSARVIEVRRAADTLLTVNDTTEDNDKKAAARVLERARLFYRNALVAQKLGDSLLAQTDFEEAINNLNEASYFPGIDENADFNELSKTVIEDYEKYIAMVDTLTPQSSIDALHEKMNEEVERIDISNIEIPPNFIPKTTVPLVMNEYVKRSIAFFATRGRHHLERWIRLSGRYFPMMFRIFREEGVPEEMVYLSMPESGLNPTVRSWAKAVGMWQFVRGTGAMYGLKGNFWYDERRDPEKATRAAARHLKDLYTQYNDWYLVLVGYNAGGGRVNRGIRLSGSNDFWEMRDHLPAETRNYIPQYIAVTLMAMKPESFGLNVEKEDTLRYDVVSVDDCVDLAVLAECAGTSLEVIRDLNPELLQWCTPPNYKGYRLKVPVGASARFAEQYAQIPPEKKQDWIVHKVRRGETANSIAKHYGMLTSVMMEMNRLPRSKRLKPNMTLVIPVRGRSLAAKIDKQEEDDALRTMKASLAADEKTTVDDEEVLAPAGKTKIVYKTRRGEKLTSIARRFAVRTTDIRIWNDIAYGKTVRAGARITLFVPSAKIASYRSMAGVKVMAASPHARSMAAAADQKSPHAVHRVTRGETLEKIARSEGVTMDELKEWNDLSTSTIKIGQKLKLHGSEAKETMAASKAETKQSKTKRPIAAVEPKAGKSKAVAQASDAKPSKKHAAAKQTYVTYSVKRGDTLERISKKFDVAVTELKKWNDLSSNKIKAGDKIRIQQDLN